MGSWGVPPAAYVDHPKIGLDKMIFIDGDDFIKNMPKILMKLEDMLIERKILLTKKYFELRRFEKDPKTGFWCYRPKNSVRRCLTDSHPG